ncbi:MAG: hypothetical protein V3S40_11765, partial [Kiloniellales bacterium]
AGGVFRHASSRAAGGVGIGDAAPGCHGAPEALHIGPGESLPGKRQDQAVLPAQVPALGLEPAQGALGRAPRGVTSAALI